MYRKGNKLNSASILRIPNSEAKSSAREGPTPFKYAMGM